MRWMCCVRTVCVVGCWSCAALAVLCRSCVCVRLGPAGPGVMIYNARKLRRSTHPTTTSTDSVACAQSTPAARTPMPCAPPARGPVPQTHPPPARRRPTDRVRARRRSRHEPQPTTTSPSTDATAYHNPTSRVARATHSTAKGAVAHVPTRTGKGFTLQHASLEVRYMRLARALRRRPTPPPRLGDRHAPPHALRRRPRPRFPPAPRRPPEPRH